MCLCPSILCELTRAHRSVPLIRSTCAHLSVPHTRSTRPKKKHIACLPCRSSHTPTRHVERRPHAFSLIFNFLNMPKMINKMAQKSRKVRGCHRPHPTVSFYPTHERSRLTPTLSMSGHSSACDMRHGNTHECP